MGKELKIEGDIIKEITNDLLAFKRLIDSVNLKQTLYLFILKNESIEARHTLNEEDFTKDALSYIIDSIHIYSRIEDFQILLNKDFLDFFQPFYNLNIGKLDNIIDNYKKICELLLAKDVDDYSLLDEFLFLNTIGYTIETSTIELKTRFNSISNALGNIISENNSNSIKLKWNGNASQLGFIINQLAVNGFIEFPFRNSEINFTELARQVLNAFELNKETNEKYMATQINIDSNENKLSEENKIKLKFRDDYPYCKDL